MKRGEGGGGVGGIGPSENWVIWGGEGTKFFARKGDKPEKGGGGLM